MQWQMSVRICIEVNAQGMIRRVIEVRLGIADLVMSAFVINMESFIAVYGSNHGTCFLRHIVVALSCNVLYTTSVLCAFHSCVGI